MKNSFTSSDEVFEWLSKFINLERGQKVKSFRLDRMEFLAELAGNPQKCAPSVHIAGSKGKGSVTGMITAILTEAGYRAARYMSPHVADIRERLCLGGSYFDEEIYVAAGGELRELVEERLPATAAAQLKHAALFDNASEEGAEPTYFELLTLYFFLCARRANCEALVVETGMGGRLDSTNVLDPLVSVITIIELEHTAFLGNTIAAVAGEKAGIIKQGKPLVLAKQRDETPGQALEIFKEKAKEKNSELLYLPDIAELSDINVTAKGTEFTLSLKKPAFNLQPPIHSVRFSISIPGKVQAENAALAIAAVKTAFPQTSEDAIRRGLAKFSLPARFEKIAPPPGSQFQNTQPCYKQMPPFIIDGAHTPESLALAIETFCLLYGEGGVLIFGCAADKDAAAMAEAAFLATEFPATGRFAKIIITTPGTFKASDPAKVYEAFARQAAARGYGQDKTLLVTDTQEAINEAVRETLPVLGTGSFYLASEIRKYILSEAFTKIQF